MTAASDLIAFLATAYRSGVLGQQGDATATFREYAKDPEFIVAAKAKLAEIDSIRVGNLAQRDFALYQAGKALRKALAEFANAPR